MVLNGSKNKMMVNTEISNPTKRFDDVVTQALKYKLRDLKKKKKWRNINDDMSSESSEEVTASPSDSDFSYEERKRESKTKRAEKTPSKEALKGVVGRNWTSR